jgi:hypothetical protein
MLQRSLVKISDAFKYPFLEISANGFVEFDAVWFETNISGVLTKEWPWEGPKIIGTRFYPGFNLFEKSEADLNHTILLCSWQSLEI